MRIVLFLAALVLASCSPPARTYSPETEMGFMRACEARNEVPGVCACIWDKIEAEISANDFAALEQLPGPEREVHPLMQQINNYAFSCADELRTEPAPIP